MGSSNRRPFFTVTLSKAKGLKHAPTMGQYYVYIVTNRSRTLYTGVTNNLERRVYEHRHGLVRGFTRRYNITRLVYYETSGSIDDAIAREKQIKGWLRSKKISLI